MQIRAAPFFTVLMGDSRGYDEWAQRIAAGEWLGREVFYQAPLYPYLLGAIYTVAGRHLLLVRLVQIVIGSASCALLGLAVARLLSTRAGLVAGLMLALYAPAIFFDGLLQKSVLDVFFVCLALWLIARITTTINAELAESAEQELPVRSLRFLRSLRSTSSSLWLCLGLTMGGLALTRENALVLIAVIVVWAAFAPSSQRRFGAQGARSVAWLLLGVAIVVLPVAARNAYVGGGFYVTTSQFGPNFYIGNNPSADGTYQPLRFGRGAPEYERQDATELAETALGRTLSPAEVSSFWVDKALEFITGRPGAWLTLTARKVALLANATEMVDTESQETHAEWSWPLRIGGWFGHFGVLVPLAVFGGILTWPRRTRLGIVYALAIAYAASVVLFYVFARYRYPLVPLLIVFAAGGIDQAAAALARRQWRVDPLPLAAVALVAVFANWPMLSATLMRAITRRTSASPSRTMAGWTTPSIATTAPSPCSRTTRRRNNLGAALHAKAA
jgi:4-amino-4-deoxy-L-arabinose transferase-like glycosyltransferase